MFEKESSNCIPFALKEQDKNNICNLDMRMKIEKRKESRFYLRTNTSQFEIVLQIIESIIMCGFILNPSLFPFSLAQSEDLQNGKQKAPMKYVRLSQMSVLVNGGAVASTAFGF